MKKNSELEIYEINFFSYPQGEENTRRIEENGKTVLVVEQRHIEAINKRANIVIKGTPERLMQQLVEVENYVDPTYVEDFLLTHRFVFVEIYSLSFLLVFNQGGILDTK